MKILIVVPRTLLSDDINYAYMFPLGLAYLSSVLKQAGHSVEGFNLNHYAGSVESLLRDKIDAENKYDFVLVNFANPDLVGHSGKLNAVIKAIQTVDNCTGKIVEKVLEKNGAVLLTSDHGNAEEIFFCIYSYTLSGYICRTITLSISHNDCFRRV